MLYFDLPKMNSPLYHGKTIFHEIDTKKPVNLNIVNEGFVNFKAENILPEYFIIVVPAFNNVINKEIDEWLYVMKNSDTREDFKSPYMARVKERLDVLKMSDSEREEYYHYKKESVKSQDLLLSAEEKGIAKGIEKGIIKGREEGITLGIEKEKISTAIAMIKDGLPTPQIEKYTDLSYDEISKIKKNLEAE